MRRVVVMVALLACRPAIPPVPGRGGPAWTQLESEHFTLWTDASAGRGRELIRQMEHLRQIVLGVGFAGRTSDGRALVIAFRDQKETSEYLPPTAAAVTFPDNVLGQPAIILSADVDNSQYPVVTHELAHLISHGGIHRQPPWFAEGLANFFETVKLDSAQTSGEIGNPIPQRIAWLRRGAPTPAAKMFACRGGICRDGPFYATAWAMFAFLANTRPADLTKFAVRLDQVSADAAWAEVFPDLTPAKLDHELRRWLTYGRRTVWRFDVRPREWPVTERPMTDGEVYAVRGFAGVHARRKDAASNVEAALAADPTNLVANVIAAFQLQRPITPDLAHRVAAAHPNDWRAWWLVWTAGGGKGPSADAARNRGCSIVPTGHIPPTNWCPVAVP